VNEFFGMDITMDIAWILQPINVPTEKLLLLCKQMVVVFNIPFFFEKDWKLVYFTIESVLETV